jgi:hypothetical protein
MSKHSARSERAANALDANPEWTREQSAQEAITDAVTDLLTLAAKRGIHPRGLADRALRHIEAEAPKRRATVATIEALAEEAAILAATRREADEGSNQSLCEVDELRANLNESTLDAVVYAISDATRNEHAPEVLDNVAAILRAAGCDVAYAISD